MTSSSVTVCLSFISISKKLPPHFSGLAPPLDFEEILQQPFTSLGQDGLRVELDAMDRVLPVHEAHDLFLLGPSSDFEAIGQGIALDDE